MGFAIFEGGIEICDKVSWSSLRFDSVKIPLIIIYRGEVKLLTVRCNLAGPAIIRRVTLAVRRIGAHDPDPWVDVSFSLELLCSVTYVGFCRV